MLASWRTEKFGLASGLYRPGSRMVTAVLPVVILNYIHSRASSVQNPGGFAFFF